MGVKVPPSLVSLVKIGRHVKALKNPVLNKECWCSSYIPQLIALGMLSSEAWKLGVELRAAVIRHLTRFCSMQWFAL